MAYEPPSLVKLTGNGIVLDGILAGVDPYLFGRFCQDPISD